MDISVTQYSDASESGWTHYLDQSSFSESYFQRNIVEERIRIMEEETEEDLSMVSDASSGPPHYDNNECYYEKLYSCHSSKSKESQKKKKQVKEYGKSQQQTSSQLDDTASSPFFSSLKESHKEQDSLSWNGGVEDALDFSGSVSATTIKKKNKFKKHFSFFEHSFTGKLASEESDKERK